MCVCIYIYVGYLSSNADAKYNTYMCMTHHAIASRTI